MESSVVALARQAAAAARAERAAQEAAMRPVRKYRGVQKRRNRFAASIWNPDTRRPMWLGSYATPEEAAYAYDAAARRIQGLWARPNFPEPSSARAAPGQVVGAAQAPEARVTVAPVLTNLELAWRAEVLAPARNSPLLPTPGPQASLLHWAAPAQVAPPATQFHQGVIPAGYYVTNQRAGPALPECLFRLTGSTTCAAVPNGTGVYRAFPSIPGGYIPVTLNELGLNCPASSELSSTELQSSAAGVPRRRRLTISPAMAVEHGAVVGDNFSNNGASSSVASTSGW